MRTTIGILLAVSLGAAALPEFRVSGVQPFSDEMRSAYGILPSLSLGLLFPRSPRMGVELSLAGTYGQSRPVLGETRLMGGSLRAGVVFLSGPPAGFYFVPGLQFAYAAEQLPAYDTATGVISRRYYGGTGLGTFISAGLPVTQVGAWRLGVEAALDLISVTTDEPYPDEWYGYRTRLLALSSLSVGLVLARGTSGFGN